MDTPKGSVEPHSTPSQPPKSVFLAASVLIFFLTLSAADSIGFVPDYIDGTAEDAPVVAESLSSQSVALSNLPELGTADATPALPERIVIPAIELDLAIQNPDTRNIEALDELLKQGPARYVDSSEVGVVGGNVLIFAHSSNLPVVRNPMFKAFNKIPELKAGDSVSLYADGKKYLYIVTSVKKVAASDTRIDMSPTLGTRLTLVTCDTLTSKDARYVLEASFIGAYEI